MNTFVTSPYPFYFSFSTFQSSMTAFNSNNIAVKRTHVMAVDKEPVPMNYEVVDSIDMDYEILEPVDMTTSQTRTEKPKMSP